MAVDELIKVGGYGIYVCDICLEDIRIRIFMLLLLYFFEGLYGIRDK
jgi:hypothetical protein